MLRLVDGDSSDQSESRAFDAGVCEMRSISMNERTRESVDSLLRSVKYGTASRRHKPLVAV